jgi:hypothetical protein
MRKENNSPTSVFNAFITARRDGDLEAVKSTLSVNTLKMVEEICVAEKWDFINALNSMAQIYLQSKNGRLPRTQNEKIGGEVACLEVEDVFSNKFKSFVFLKENGFWKLAFDMEVIEVIEDKAILEKLFDSLKTVFSNLFGNLKAKS